jgi:mono/diheme cytochrome c family protein
MTSRAPRSMMICLLACALVSGCKAPGRPGRGPEVPRPEDVSDFATLYAQNCAACHGEHGRNGAAISLDNPAYLAIAGVANIQRVTVNGVPNTAMPPFSKTHGGMLTDKQIAILAQGMISTWGNPTALAGQIPPAYAGTAPGNPVQGAQTFATFCARCHGADATGMGATGAHPGNGPATGSLVDPHTSPSSATRGSAA